MDNIELWRGDCLELMCNIPDKSVDMILCDPPYGTTACKWDKVIPFEPLWKQYNRIIKDNGVILLFGSEPFSSYLRMSNIKNYKYDWYWDKVTGTGHLIAKYQPMQKIENISVFYKSRPTYNPQLVKLSEEEYKKKISKLSKKESYQSNSELTPARKELSVNDINIEQYYYKQPNNVLTYSKYMCECNNINRKHPTQKPVALLEYLIKTYTNKNETVLDNCMGSGSTGVACVNTDRKFIGIELDNTYFEIAKERIEKTVENTKSNL